ncbi:MAG: hypothetical protein WD335_02640 [Candidatus Paceibacterota bacterium]
MNKLSKAFFAVIPAAFVVAATPLVATAQLENVGNFVDSLQTLINGLIPLVAAIALLAFFWGLAKYVFQADDEEAKAKGKNIMIGGIVALFLVAAIGGIIQFIVDAFGIDSQATINPTNIDTSSN